MFVFTFYTLNFKMQLLQIWEAIFSIKKFIGRKFGREQIIMKQTAQSRQPIEEFSKINPASGETYGLYLCQLRLSFIVVIV